eukprot:TRINITY_DN111864_c0_g1_i2.p1 TRINITY_DN111864_c0_g1~~TRINITY_DN111864_c0_g1_i2.p1  ORF type:complete len:294 (+),score=33.38 TRINITY_DN111864_c0_g1_i2:88-882(+)
MENYIDLLERMPVRFDSGGAASAGHDSEVSESGEHRWRIVAYGDSLTAGYADDGCHFYPYGAAMAKALGEAGASAEVHVCGLSGMTAKEMVDGLGSPALEDVMDFSGEGLQHMLKSSGPHDVAIIMAGTNDLARSRSARTLVRRIQKLHAACHAAGVPTVLLSVPPNQWSADEDEDEYRSVWADVNKQLLDWAAEPANKLVVLSVDTDKVVPYSRDSEVWDCDGLHLTPEGSAQLGIGVAKELELVLQTLPRRSCTPAAAPTTC